MRFLLRGRVAMLTVPVLVGTGLTMIYGGDFGLGIASLVVGAAWGIGAWLVSDYLAKKKPKRKKRTTPKEIKQADYRYRFWQLSIPALIVITLFLSCLFALNKHKEKELQALRERLKTLQDSLEPGNEPTPPSVCSNDGKEGVTRLFLGTHGNVFEVARFPHTVLVIGNRRSLELERSDDGKIFPVIDILSPDGRIIVRMNKRDGFVINPNNELIVRRPDTSTLIVEDQEGKEVLNAKYLNRHAFKLTGIFTIPGIGRIPLEVPSMYDICIEAGPHGEQFESDIVINVPRVP